MNFNFSQTDTDKKQYYSQTKNFQNNNDTIENEEYISDYKIEEEYKPLNKGQVLLERYIIKQNLGQDNFGSNWLALDIKYNNYVSIKINNSENKYLDEKNNEIDILEEIGEHNFDEDWIKSLKEYHKDEPLILTELENIEHSQVIQLLNTFVYNGHLCMVFEIMGNSLLELIKTYNYKGIPLPYVRIIVKQILIGLDFLHRICNIIHCNLKPENILVCLNKDELTTIEETGYLKEQEQEQENRKNNLNDYISNQSNKKVKNNMDNNNYIDMDIDDDGDEDKDSNFNIINKGDDDDDNYNLEDLIERPRILSVPKLNLETENENINNIFDIDIMSYSNDIQSYIKERKRITHDEKYRNKLIRKNKLLSKAKTEKEKKDIFLKLNKENNQIKEIDPDINVKICDLSSACKFNKRTNKFIQTREYRAPEIILGINYNETVDIWSLGCIVFELATGDLLFEPVNGPNYGKNDDQLAKFIQILGKMPKKLVLRGSNSNKFFNKSGKLQRIKEIKSINLKDILINKYYFKENEAQALTDFIMPMLEYYPEKRATARQMLRHPWLKMPSNFNYFMNEEEINKNNNKEKKGKNNINNYDNSDKEMNENNDVYSSDSELYKADDEDNDKKDFYKEYKDEEDSGDENPDKINIPNYNNSFAEYGQFIDLTNLDRANPQFDEILKNEN